MCIELFKRNLRVISGTAACDIQHLRVGIGCNDSDSASSLARPADDCARYVGGPCANVENTGCTGYGQQVAQVVEQCAVAAEPAVDAIDVLKALLELLGIVAL